MKRTHLASAILFSAAVSSGAWAQDNPAASANNDAELDIIMSVVDENDTPDDVINRIELPPAPEAVVDLPDVELAEPPLDRAGEVVEDVTKDAATHVTESINDALSTGDLESLPKDITDALPEEAIDELLNDATGDVDELVDEVTGTGADDAIDSALDELDLDDELESTDALDATVDELDSVNDSVIDELDGTLDQQDAAKDVLDDVGGGL